MKATTVCLEPTNDSNDVLTFEQAFGDYSEARGKGRARREARRAARAKRKLTRQAVKSARKQARIKKRADAQRARQEKRTARVKMAQERRMLRKQGRLARKALGKEEEGETEEGETEEGTTEDGSTEDGGGSNGGSGGGSNGGYDGGSDDGAYSEDSGSVSDDSEGSEEGSYEGSEDSADEEVDADENAGESDDESGFTGDIGFDGTIGASAEDIRWQDYFSSAEGNAKINPNVTKIAKSIEQHKEAISQLEKQIDAEQEKGQNSNRCNAQINRHRSQLDKLEDVLGGYSAFDGEDLSQARGGKDGLARRKAEVRVAKHQAREERKSYRKRKRKINTQVQRGLKAKMGKNSIVVPAEELSGFNATGTGLIALDSPNDFDAPETRKFDLLFSNAEGDQKAKRKKLFIGVGIGVAVGILTIILIKKFSKK